MNYFTFNNRNSLLDLNLGIVGNSTRPRPQEIIEREQVEGRRKGSLVYKTGAYKDLIVDRKLRLLTFNDYEIETLKIMNWLSDIEDNRLILKDYPQKCYRVKYAEVGNFEDYRGGNVDFDVSFVCEPFIYNTNEQELTLTNGELIFNDGFLASEPVIKLDLPQNTQSISINVGPKTIQLNGVKGTVIIDSQIPRAICEGIEIKTIGGFPALEIGKNIISWTGTVNKFSLSKNLVYRG